MFSAGIDWYALYNQVADYIGAHPWALVLAMLGPSIWVLLARAPFDVVADVMQRRQRWRAVPLQQRNMTRATVGAFVLVLLIGAAADGFIPFDNKLALLSAAGIAGFSLLYIAAGVFGSRCKVDPLSIFWWSVTAAAGVVALLLVFGGEMRW